MIARSRDRTSGRKTAVPNRNRITGRLDEVEARFATLAANIEEVYWIGDPSTGRVLYANPAFESLWGRSVEELYEDAACWNGAVVRSDQGAPPRVPESGTGDWEYQIRLPDGTTKWIRDRRFAIKPSASGAPRVAGIAADITERKRQELERGNLARRERETESAASAVVRARDEFLSAVSHELRSPLNVVTGWAHVLGHSVHDPGVIAHGADAIRRNAENLQRIIDNLLDAARAIQRQLNVSMRPASLTQVIQAALDARRDDLAARGQRIDVEFDDAIDTIVIDPERIQRVVDVLLSNAMKFSGRNATIQVSTHRDGQEAVLNVTDEGVGIPADELNHVFDRFHEVHAARASNYSGVGLGLPIARHLVELHGGSLQASSPGSGRGATFTIRLPMPKLPVPVPTERSEPLAGLTVLIVDDSDDGREAAEVLLVAAGANVLGFDNAKAALAALPALRQDVSRLVVVSDVAMPGMDGYEMMRALRRAEGSGALPHLYTIALTAFSGPEERTRAHHAGFDDYLGKPFDPATLIAALAASAPSTQHGD